VIIMVKNGIDKESMLDSWLDDWSSKIDDLESKTGRDKPMPFDLFQKYTYVMMKLLALPSKIFILSKSDDLQEEE